METTRDTGSGGSDTGSGESPSVVPLWQQQVMLLLRGECLSGAAKQALEAGDEATAARMIAEAIQAFQQARELAEKARAQ